jgi:hypothetical protein
VYTEQQQSTAEDGVSCSWGKPDALGSVWLQLLRIATSALRTTMKPLLPCIANNCSKAWYQWWMKSRLMTVCGLGLLRIVISPLPTTMKPLSLCIAERMGDHST